jgi:hypothetical protein
MIAYGCAVGDTARYRRLARAGIHEVAHGDAPLRAVDAGDSIFAAYNKLADWASGCSDLEALVLVHEDCRIRDAAFESKLRSALAQDEVAIVGAFGGTGVGGIDWWIHERMIGSATLVSAEPFAPAGHPLLGAATVVGPGGSGEVDAVDGMLIALSPWALCHLRFDEALGPGFHGYDIDICFQARQKKRRVLVTEIEVEHHRHELVGESSREAWKRAHVAFRRKWELRWPLPPPVRGTTRTPAARDVAGPV